MFGAFRVIPDPGWKRHPECFKKLLVSIPVAAPVCLLVGGYPDEPREPVNLYPVLIPAGLIALFPNSTALKTAPIDSE